METIRGLSELVGVREKGQKGQQIFPDKVISKLNAMNKSHMRLNIGPDDRAQEHVQMRKRKRTNWVGGGEEVQCSRMQCIMAAVVSNETRR